MEGKSLTTIAKACGVTKLLVRQILADDLYTRIGVLDQDAVTGRVVRLTPVSLALFILCQRASQVGTTR